MGVQPPGPRLGGVHGVWIEAENPWSKCLHLADMGRSVLPSGAEIKASAAWKQEKKKGAMLRGRDLLPYRLSRKNWVTRLKMILRAAGSLAPWPRPGAAMTSTYLPWSISALINASVLE